MEIKQISKLYEVKNSKTTAYVCKIKTNIEECVSILFVFLQGDSNIINSIAVPMVNNDFSIDERIKLLRKAWEYTNNNEYRDKLQDELDIFLNKKTIEILDNSYSWHFIYRLL